MSSPTPQPSATAWRPGLKVHKHSSAGFIVETTEDHHRACERHERVVTFVDTHANRTKAHAGGFMLLQHVVDNLILCEVDLWLATGEDAVIYRHGEDHYIEWADELGWLDRRLLSPASAVSITAQGTWQLSKADRQWAARTLRQLVPEARDQPVWTAFLSDAQAWWYMHASGPLRDHVFRMRRLQVLSRTDFARGFAQGARVSNTADETAPQLPEMADFPRSGVRNGKMRTVLQLRKFAGMVASDRPSKAEACRRVAEHISLLMPLAASESQACLWGLGAFRHALVAGGAKGGYWAAVTIVEYLREGLEPTVEAMSGAEPDKMDGAAFHALYLQTLQKVAANQRAKCGAFLQVFHRYMVIAGAEPLPWPLLVGAPLLPPAAAVVHPADFRAALAYVEARAPSEQIRLQATIILRLGISEPVRTYEFWCLRVGDVQGVEDMWLVIYPRLVDGICKSPHLRRVADIKDLELRRDLLTLQRLRRADGAGDEDVLFGVSGEPLARHEEQLTTALTNAALQWATGKRYASIYDLRHTCFSTRAVHAL